MQPRFRWWERRWVTNTLGVFGGLLSLVSSCVGYGLATDRASRCGDRITKAIFAPAGDLVYGLVDHDLLDDEGTRLVAWNTATGRQLWAAPAPSDYFELYTYQGGLLIVGKDSLRLLSSTTGKVRWQRENDLPFSNHNHVEFSPDGRRFYIHHNEGIQVYETETGKTVADLDHKGSFTFAVLPDGKLVLREKREEQQLLVKVDPKTQKTVGALARNVDVWAISPDRTLLVVQSGHYLFARDTRTGKLLAQLQRSEPRRPEFSPDGRRVILGGSENRVWNPRANKSRPANPEEGNSNLWYSLDQRLTLVPESAGRKGHRLPIAILQDTQTMRTVCTLEGQTGW